MKKPYRFWISLALIFVALVLTVLAFVLDGDLNNFVIGIVNMVILAIVVYWLDYSNQTLRSGG